MRRTFMTAVFQSAAATAVLVVPLVVLVEGCADRAGTGYGEKLRTGATVIVYGQGPTAVGITGQPGTATWSRAVLAVGDRGVYLDAGHTFKPDNELPPMCRVRMTTGEQSGGFVFLPAGNLVASP